MQVDKKHRKGLHMELEKQIKLQIEKAREELNKGIDNREDSEIIYSKSVKLDKLIEDYIAVQQN